MVGQIRFQEGGRKIFSSLWDVPCTVLVCVCVRVCVCARTHTYTLLVLLLPTDCGCAIVRFHVAVLQPQNGSVAVVYQTHTQRRPQHYNHQVQFGHGIVNLTCVELLNLLQSHIYRTPVFLQKQKAESFLNFPTACQARVSVVYITG